jgi:hypothetical protein
LASANQRSCRTVPSATFPRSRPGRFRYPTFIIPSRVIEYRYLVPTFGVYTPHRAGKADREVVVPRVALRITTEPSSSPCA